MQQRLTASTSRARPSQIARRGIRSFQISAVFPHLTALQNVRVGLQRTLGSEFHFWSSARSLRRLDDRAMDLLTQVGLTDFAHVRTVELAYDRKRALEIATTLAMEPELMLLDEPTHGMGHEDVDRVTALIKKVSAGRTILMVEHNMNVIAGISDTITVLQRGEVVTLLDRNGAGRTTTLRAIMGLTGRRRGSIRIADRETIALPTHRIAHGGVGYCPEERGIFSSLSCEENLLLPPRAAARSTTTSRLS